MKLVGQIPMLNITRAKISAVTRGFLLTLDRDWDWLSTSFGSLFLGRNLMKLRAIKSVIAIPSQCIT
jgi:hypothetical protein